jgi:FkbM family methyltransferase
VKSSYKGSIKAISLPSSICGRFSLQASIQNDSDRTWSSSETNPVHVAYHWLDEDWNVIVFEGKRTELPTGGIRPGAHAEIEVLVHAPPQHGEYRLCLTLVEEGVSWFELHDWFSPQVLKLTALDEQPVLAPTRYGQFWIMPSDTVIGASILQNGFFEEEAVCEVTNFLCRTFSFSPVQFVDIGANIGTHLVYALHQRLFETGIAIEAEPRNYDLLTRNIRQNGLESRVRSFQYAVSNRAGTALLEMAPDNRGDHRIRESANSTPHGLYNESARETVSLMSKTLDNLDAKYQLGIGPHSLIWIDTQGHEGYVLEGAGRLVETGRIRYVVCELWPYGLERSGGKDKIFNFLARCEAVYDIRVPNWQESEPLRLADLGSKYEELLSAGVGHTDLLCIA